MKRILAVIAHPDDESFGFGGTLAVYAEKNCEIHVLSATRGEGGGTGDLGVIRENELRKASKILGVREVDFMGFQDGALSNSLYHDITREISRKMHSFKPELVVTFDRLGVSGHLDHVAVSLTTTYVVEREFPRIPLYYYALTKTYTDIINKRLSYFIHFPAGYHKDDFDVIIDTARVWDKKVAAMKCHKTQMHDVQRILKYQSSLPRRENFLQGLSDSHGLKRNDFFTV